jgi:N utilization substance protein B
MLNRRHLRIKILQALYAFEQSKDNNVSRSEKELLHSIQKMYDMYLYLMVIMTDIHEVASRRIEDGKKKRLPTEEDLNPNMRFVENKFLKQLASNRALLSQAEKAKVNWMGEGELLRRLFKLLAETEEYRAYMAAPENDYAADREVVIRIFKRHLINAQSLHDFFEERSIFWIDDLDLVASMAIKTFKSFEEETDEFQPLLPLWKDPDDEQSFVKLLFRKTIVQSPEHMELIHKHTDNWELDRIALMDIILMKMALTEGREFPEIPVKVTLNEYIEISKYYSTPKSNTFINGVLDKLFEELKASGKIKKVGRGLIT